MKQTIPFSFTIDVQDAPPPPVPSGIVSAFPVSTTHPDWPTYLLHCKPDANGVNQYGYGIFTVALAWSAAGRTDNVLRDWCVTQFRKQLAAAILLWNAGKQITYLSQDNYLYAASRGCEWLTVMNWMGNQLTAQEHHDAGMILDQCVFNIWNPGLAKWGGIVYKWSGWAIDDPWNNYFYRSHWRITLWWAIHSQSQTWLDKVASLIPFIESKYQFKGPAGSWEGTGYGQSYPTLYQDVWITRAAFGHDMSGPLSVADDLDYWCNAITPDFKSFAPMGDQAGSQGSYPTINDNIRALLIWGIMLVPDSPGAARARYVLSKIGIRAASGASYSLTTYDTSGPQLALPANASFYSPAEGHLFARSADGALVTFACGRSYESHDAFDETEVMIYVGGKWRMVTNTVYRASGLGQPTQYHNCVVFTKSDGKTAIVQRKTFGNTMTHSDDGTVLKASGDATDCYQSSDVKMCRRDFIFDRANRKASTHDTFTLANGATGAWSASFADLPILQADGSYLAGPLRVRCLTPGVTSDVIDWDATDQGWDFAAGRCWRLRFMGGIEYSVEVSW